MPTDSRPAWPSFALTDVFDVRSGLSKPASEFGSGFPFVTFKDVLDNYFLPETLGSLVRSSEMERELCDVRRGDVFLTRTSEKQEELGMSSVALRDYDGATFNGFTKRLRPKDPRQIVPEYVAYYLRSPRFRSEMSAFSSLSTRASLNNDMLGRLQIVLPERKIQEEIGYTLRSLDDKIEQNRRTSRALEELARATFKAWFVDYEPVKVKAAGQTSFPGLPPAAFAAFPDRLTDSPLGPVPQGWEVTTIGEVAKVTSGKRPATKFSAQTDAAPIPLWGGNGPMAFVSEALYREPLLLTGRVGTLGVVFRINEPCWPSDNTLVVLPEDRLMYELLYFELQQIEFSSLNRGSTQPLLTQSDLKAHRIALPKEPLLSAFHDITSKLFSLFDSAEHESRKLAALRDYLLPRLLSGRVRVRPSQQR